MFKKTIVFTVAFLAVLLLGFVTSTASQTNNTFIARDFTPLPTAPLTGWPPLPPRGVDGTPELPEHLQRTFVKVRVGQSQGSGFVYAPGYVITNAHVVMEKNGENRAGTISVSLRNRTVTARIVAYSPSYDMAILSVPRFLGEPAPLATVPPILGDVLLAVGHPSSNAWIARGPLLSTTTRISHRYNERHTPPSVAVLIYDARVLQGYSGGPTMNADGEIVGLTVGLVGSWHNAETGRMERSARQVAVAYPIHLIKAEADRLMANL